MIRPKNVPKPEKRHRIWLEFSDGAVGEVDLSHLAAAVSSRWDTPGCFDSVRLGPGR